MAFNPFSPGVYSPGQEIFGREEQLHVVEQVTAGIENGVPHAPVCFAGPPGVGKTFLLRNIANALRERRWLCGYTESGPDIGSAIHDILADAQEIAPRRSSARRLMSRVTGVNSSAVSFSFSLTLQPASDGSAYTQLVRLFKEINNRAGSNYTGAALLLDEAQVLPDGQINQLFRALAAVEDSRIMLFMAALPGLASTISSIAQSPAPWRRLSTPYVQFSALGALDLTGARAVLEYQAGTASAEFEPEAVAALTSFALGHPLTLQMLGRSAWDAAAAASYSGMVIVRAAHATTAIAEVTKQLTTLYHKPDWSNCSDRERALLKQLARMGGSASGPDLAHAVKGTDSDPEAIISGMIDGGLLYDNLRTDTVSMVIPGFSQFVMSA